MFEFLSKLVSRRPSLPTVTPIAAELLQQAQISDARQKTIEQERQQYIQKISASINDQASLLDLLSACDFADGRYMAAQHIVSQEYLEKALQISRKVDKRVAKLMQMRLDEIRQQQSLHQKVQACMQQADHLLAQPSVLANQLVELEKQFAQLAALPAELSNSFEEKRQSLQARLNAQIDLQRQFLHPVQRCWKTRGGSLKQRTHGS